MYRYGSFLLVNCEIEAGDILTVSELLCYLLLIAMCFLRYLHLFSLDPLDLEMHCHNLEHSYQHHSLLVRFSTSLTRYSLFHGHQNM